MAGVATEEKVEEKAGEKFIFGCIHNTNIILPDLLTGPRGTESALRFVPGEVLDLEEYFSPGRLKRARSLKLALNNGWLIPCKSVDEKITPKKWIATDGEAPINEFDLKLAEELDKEEAELERLRQGHDALGARARRVKAQQAKGTA